MLKINIDWPQIDVIGFELRYCKFEYLTMQCIHEHPPQNIFKSFSLLELLKKSFTLSSMMHRNSSANKQPSEYIPLDIIYCITFIYMYIFQRITYIPIMENPWFFRTNICCIYRHTDTHQRILVIVRIESKLPVRVFYFSLH